ncbi:MAG: hypothetical protein II358_01465, partial [Tidjanibacter sp.]|nr:hypothetical protein [Tidjanibacter sp.]
EHFRQNLFLSIFLVFFVGKSLEVRKLCVLLLRFTAVGLRVVNVKRLLNFFNKFAKSKITRTFAAKFLRFI